LKSYLREVVASNPRFLYPYLFAEVMGLLHCDHPVDHGVEKDNGFVVGF
jgi:hypothetical protein